MEKSSNGSCASPRAEECHQGLCPGLDTWILESVLSLRSVHRGEREQLHPAVACSHRVNKVLKIKESKIQAYISEENWVSVRTAL